MSKSWNCPKIINHTHLFISLMSLGHRKPRLRDGSLEITDSQGVAQVLWGKWQAMILWLFSVITWCQLCLWACRAPDLMRKRRDVRQGATHQGGGEINELCLQVFCGIIQRQADRDGARSKAWVKSSTDVSWRTWKAAHWQSWTRMVLILWNYPKMCDLCYFFTNCSLLTPPLLHPLPYIPYPSPTPPTGFPSMVEKWLPMLTFFMRTSLASDHHNIQRYKHSFILQQSLNPNSLFWCAPCHLNSVQGTIVAGTKPW